ncbi:helicase [Chroococcidiopsis cubana CCALA 043]|uniref:helicase-related protein n=1 Tax=Chroococcidiopsis cubana TaxID=171392 RepID=UPI000D05C9C2|nr:helicase-related protein [Chroococcidiopsis cubana]PSB65367.1 helicase [Chroococcidiopsis cubana CCALA 043]
MLENVIQDLIRKQRPYYLPQGNPIKGIDNQHWLVFKHRDADTLLRNIVTFLGIGGKHATHKLLRIDPKRAKVFTYAPRFTGSIPSTTLLRTSPLTEIAPFLELESTTEEKTLLAGSFIEVQSDRRRRFNLPDELEKYNTFIGNVLERSHIYRRSTAYFDSGVLKLYEEPLQKIIQNEGEIRLLLDWHGFTKQADIEELEKLQDPDYRAQYFRRTLKEFLQGLADRAFTGTEILAELVRLGFLQIKLVKMESGRAIYHKKTGIFSDSLDNHILHEGSDNFTRAAHGRNAESLLFLYSWEEMDAEAIADSIRQFDAEWQRQDTTFDLSQEFLQQVLAERDRRAQADRPVIEAIAPDEFIPGETTPVEITGRNLDLVDEITVADNELVKVTIDTKEKERIVGRVEVDPQHPPIPLTDFQAKTSTGVYRTSPRQPAAVERSLEIPEFGEILGFKQAVETILTRKHGTPQDFLYWLAQQRPHQFRVERSDLLDELLGQDVLFEHQKSGAQHCLRVMQDFGVAVCADAVGLGKTRLAAAVARLYRQQNVSAKIAIVAAKKLHPNWEREMAELGFKPNEYELYNKNLMSRKGNNFLTDFNRYGGCDFIIIDEGDEGNCQYKNRIHKTCAAIQESDRATGRQRHFLLLTATPWNNRRADIYNILSPFLSRPEGFNDLGFPPELSQWFQNREIGVENFTDNTELFRRTYRELFLQRTRQMLRDATPDLNMYAKRVAEWLPVEFEASTELALDRIFTSFETSLFIPFADPIRYLRGNVEQRSLLQNQRRFFLQRAESSMYALNRTIQNFSDRIRQLQQRLENVSPDADGLKKFLLLHYGFESEKKEKQQDFSDYDDSFVWDEDYEEDEEDEDEETQAQQQHKRQQLRRSIDIATDALGNDLSKAQSIYDRILADCDSDLEQLEQIQQLLAGEIAIDHKREQVTGKVRELVSQGHKVLLISTFSDTVIDYYRYMTRDEAIADRGIGMAIGSTKRYYPSHSTNPLVFSPNNASRGTRQLTGMKRQEIFRLFAPAATCKDPAARPKPESELAVLIGSETLSVGQNLQDADYLINIDLPWNPMILEQRIGRIDRPKQRRVENIYIYYANSENQLLRQASRLSNLHKKLVGELALDERQIPTISSIEALGASIYGDTQFDDEVLPGYIDFLNSLVKARRMEQGNLQEDTYQKQETSRDLYTHNEILHSEELGRLVQHLGEDYQANPIALGCRAGEKEEPTGLVALTIEYFGPNGEPIPDRKQTLFWNDRTGEKDGYGMAIATAFKTPPIADVLPATDFISHAQEIYQQLVALKQQRLAQIEQPESLENINITSDRISRINRRVSQLDCFPAGIDRTTVRKTFQKLNAWKEMKQVQKLLRDYTDGEKAKLNDIDFVIQLVQDADKLNLIANEGIQPSMLQVSLAAILIRI